MPSTMPSDVGWYGTISYPVGQSARCKTVTFLFSAEGVAVKVEGKLGQAFRVKVSLDNSLT